jgi:hypothetical protein
MSSSRYELRERTPQVDLPAFPPSPKVFSFENTANFAKLSQLALASITYFNRPFLHLPLISPHRLQPDRFGVSENKVFVIQRKSYAQLKALLKNVNTTKYSGIYLR